MKTLLVALIAGLIGGVVGTFVGADRIGSMVAQDHLGDEFMVHHHAYLEVEGNEQLREYLKSRMYYIACFMDRGNLARTDFDFGPVDESALNGISGIKGAESQKEIYEDAMTIHRQDKEG